MNISICLLREKIIKEYYETINNTEIFLNKDIIIYCSEYFYVIQRIYICFQNFSKYLDIDEKAIKFLLSKKFALDYLAFIFMEGFAGDCDIKSVEGIYKLIIFAYNHNVIISGESELLSIEFIL